jgi:hypothetical protein
LGTFKWIDAAAVLIKHKADHIWNPKLIKFAFLIPEVSLKISLLVRANSNRHQESLVIKSSGALLLVAALTNHARSPILISDRWRVPKTYQ